LRQVKRRGQRRKKNNVNVLPAGRDKLYIDNKGVAHTQTSDVDEVEAKFTKLFGKRPQLLGPVPAPSAPSTQGDAPAPHVAARLITLKRLNWMMLTMLVLLTWLLLNLLLLNLPLNLLLTTMTLSPWNWMI